MLRGKKKSAFYADFLDRTNGSMDTIPWKLLHLKSKGQIWRKSWKLKQSFFIFGFKKSKKVCKEDTLLRFYTIYAYFLLPIGRESIILNQILKMEIWVKLHVLKSSELENNIFCSWSVCMCPYLCVCEFVCVFNFTH